MTDKERDILKRRKNGRERAGDSIAAIYEKRKNGETLTDKERDILKRRKNGGELGGNETKLKKLTENGKTLDSSWVCMYCLDRGELKKPHIYEGAKDGVHPLNRKFVSGLPKFYSGNGKAQANCHSGCTKPKKHHCWVYLEDDEELAGVKSGNLPERLRKIKLPSSGMTLDEKSLQHH